MENVILTQINEELEKSTKTKYDFNPFIFTGELPVSVDVAILRKLKINGILVLSLINKTWFKDGSTRLGVKEICTVLFKEYNEANATRVRRGLRELLRNQVIAYSDTKDIYWVNKGAIWVK